MSTNYPTSKDTLTNPTSTDGMDSPSHSDQHTDANDAIEALQTKVGIDSSATATTVDYKLTNNSSEDPGHKHTTVGLSSSAKTGSDTKVVTGTAGTDGNLAKWNADGDAVDSGSSVADLQQTDEEIQDIAGGMFTGNTETLITATYQDGDGTIDLVVDNDLANYDNTNSGFYDADSDVDHDLTTNFVANEHIDHTSVTLTAGDGLSGGGDISSNRTFALDVSELGTEASIAAGDFIVMEDITDNGSQKITFANLEGTVDHGNLAGLDTGADHSYIDQDVTSGSSPTLDGANFSGITQSKAITVEEPTSSEDISMFFTPEAITISEMRAVLRGSNTPSVTWTIRHHATDRSNAGNEVVTGGTTTTSTTSGSDVTAFNDATIPADSFVWIETTAQSGTVDELHVTIVYDKD